jgi:acyl dehydratase
MDWTKQRYWEDVTEGEALPVLKFPLTIYRLVMSAGATRDYNAIHHNSDFAKKSGAPDMYANGLLLQAMWERSVREFIGLAGVIRALRGFRMKIFNTVGDTVVVNGKVKRKWREGRDALVEIEMWSENSKGVSVGPGSMIVTLPSKTV